MFGSSHFIWLVLLLLLALIIFGPSRLPEIGGSLGRALNEFKKATNEIASPSKPTIETEKATPEEPKTD